MKKVWIPAVLILASMSFFAGTAEARPHHKNWKHVRAPRVVCVPVRPARLCAPPPVIGPRRAIVEVNIWIPAHWEWMGSVRGYIFVPGSFR
jgi:hypothetical protein